MQEIMNLSEFKIYASNLEFLGIKGLCNYNNRSFNPILGGQILMKKGIAIFLAVSFGFAGGVSAESLFGDESYWPTQEEYEAAMVIVQRYHQRQRQLNTESEGDEIAVADEDYASILPDDQKEKSAVSLRAVSSPPVTVFGNGEIQGSSITAITADGVDGSLWVGYPDLTNQEQSGRLVFSENVYNYREVSGLCGFEFVHDGDANTLTLQGICSSEYTPYPIVTFNRGNGDPVMIERSVGIGGSYFDGPSGGGYLPVMFMGNNDLTCNDVCGNHLMTCQYAVDMTSFGASTCSSTASDIQLQLCACSN